MEHDGEVIVKRKKSEAPGPRRRPEKIVIPRRQPSVVVPSRKIVYISPDKTTCAECGCYPNEDPYVKNKKLNRCLKSPRTLYEIAADVVDYLPVPAAFSWSVDEVAVWMADTVGFPIYKESITINKINGRRLLMLEDPSRLPEINIHNFNHIKQITASVRKLFGTEFVRFCRSISLPPRKPLTHCTWFKSSTGPSWGIRQNWTRCDILRWLEIIMPAPVYLDHWDLVWYRKPEFPKIKFGRVKVPESQVHIPHYEPGDDICLEYQTPRKFKLRPDNGDGVLIWMEHRPGSPSILKMLQPVAKKKIKVTKPKDTRLMPKKKDLSNLTGRDLILAKRKTPTPKFLE